MSLRIFSVNSDGSYYEVPSRRESFLQGDGAYLIVDRKEKKIFIYRKLGISSYLSYSAGRAATNLNTKKGSKYKLIFIEEDEKDRILPSIYQKLEMVTTQEIAAEQTSTKGFASRNFVYGEKTMSKSEAAAFSDFSPLFKYKEEEPKKNESVHETQLSEDYKLQRIYELSKTLADHILSENSIDSAKQMEKPPRSVLKSELIKKIDSLLDSLYE